MRYQVQDRVYIDVQHRSHLHKLRIGKINKSARSKLYHMPSLRTGKVLKNFNVAAIKFFTNHKISIKSSTQRRTSFVSRNSSSTFSFLRLLPIIYDVYGKENTQKTVDCMIISTTAFIHFRFHRIRELLLVSIFFITSTLTAERHFHSLLKM